VPKRRYYRCEVDSWTVVREDLVDGAWRETARFWPVSEDPDAAILPAELRGVLIEGA
jgi:hypothetical protein